MAIHPKAEAMGFLAENFIKKFHDDLIHVDYIINPGIYPGTCEINDLFIEYSDEGLFVCIQGRPLSA